MPVGNWGVRVSQNAFPTITHFGGYLLSILKRDTVEIKKTDNTTQWITITENVS